MSIEYMEQGVCAKCGSGNVNLFRIERDVSILLWFECADCGCEYIEMYEYIIKGIMPGCEEER